MWVVSGNKSIGAENAGMRTRGVVSGVERVSEESPDRSEELQQRKLPDQVGHEVSQRRLALPG